MPVSNRASTDLSIAQRSAWLEDYRFGLRVSEIGRVVSVGDGITWISGLPSAAMDDVVMFEDGSRAIIFDLNVEMAGLPKHLHHSK